MSTFEMLIREDLIEIIQWHNANAARSRQIALGCSEVGDPCDRKVSYRMAALAGPNTGMDPWPAIVGTSIHAWMESAVNSFQEAHNLSTWSTELEVAPNPLVKGHTDLYRDGLVLDYKFPGRTNLSKLRSEGIPPNYLTQIQLYGLGHEQAGRRVERVGLVALGREGWLKDMLVLTVPYDKGHAEDALRRIYKLGDYLLSHELDDPQTWANIESSPSRLCSWCPMYRPGKAVDSHGCPGNKMDNSPESYFS